MIELIFVIVILGILAAVAIPKLAATRDDAKISKMATNIQTAKNEIVAQIVATGVVPTNVFATDTTTGLDDYSNVITEMAAMTVPEAVDTPAGNLAIGGEGVDFIAEDGAGGTEVCVTMEVNTTSLQVRAGAGAGTICTAIQAMVPPVTVPVRGSRVVY